MRIMKGNFLLVKDTEEIIRVKEIYENGVLSHRDIRYSENDITGIKINSNWLLKLKFTRWNAKVEDYSLGNFVIHGRKRGYVTKSSDGAMKDIHMLQNRYMFTRDGTFMDYNEIKYDSKMECRSPRIKDLPEEIRLLVIIEQMEQLNEPNMELRLTDTKNMGNFDWYGSIKGPKFWDEIDSGYEINNTNYQ